MSQCLVKSLNVNAWFGICFFCGLIDKGKVRVNQKRFTVFILFSITCGIILFLTLKIYNLDKTLLKYHGLPNSCPSSVTKMTITPMEKTKHFLVSAFMDQRIHGFDTRIIGIFKREYIKPLSCVFCCTGQFQAKTLATIFEHSDNFGFPYVTTDVMCSMPKGCAARHVILVDEQINTQDVDQPWLPIRNIETKENKEQIMKYNFTVCISVMFNSYNNVLQFTQTLEMYKLLGVDKVVIYKNSCGSELDRLLQVYIEDDFVEMVPWPIDKHLVPSHGWLHSVSGGDVHYFGQQTTLNECIYRYMERSRYVLLNDIDEIIMPYQHEDLMSLMEALAKQQPKVGVFRIENHVFPNNHYEPSKKFQLPQWSDVPGTNILEHIYRETPDRTIYHPYKLLLKPKMVEQTSIHEVLKNFGEQYKVPLEVCRIIHVRAALRGTLEVLNVDKRLWYFREKLIPNVDRILKRAGLLA